MSQKNCTNVKCYNYGCDCSLKKIEIGYVIHNKYIGHKFLLSKFEVRISSNERVINKNMIFS